ncbi:MAG: ABC transporter permease [Bacteroidota bacterium]|nr:ABC transporter permease [Bacteroidota bacterium]
MNGDRASVRNLALHVRVQLCRFAEFAGVRQNIGAGDPSYLIHPSIPNLASYHSFVAWRYLRGVQGRDGDRRFLRFILIIAVGGVAIGVAALLLALAIVRGFSEEIEAKIIGFGAHIQIENVRNEPLDQAETLTAHVIRHEAVAYVQPVVSEFALLRRSAREIDGVNLWGTDMLPTYLQGAIVDGSRALGEDSSGATRLIMGRSLADRLQLEIGETVTMLSTRTLSGSAAELVRARPRFKQLTVTGIFETSLADFDETYVFTHIDAARQFLAYASDEVTRLDVMLHDAAQAPDIVRDLDGELGLGVLSRTIYEIYRGLFAWVSLQEAIIPLVIGILIVVAAFNIMGILLMVVLEKTREIGILTAMGTTRRGIRHLYMLLGGLIGGAGTAAGISLALVLCLLQMRFGIIPLPAEAYYISVAPVSLRWTDFVLVGMIALVLCTASSYFPARYASRIDPIRVIRFN